MKVWITKYALATGIFAVDAEVCSDISGTMIKVAGRQIEMYHKPYWHETFEAAQAHALDMRDRKIKSLKKSIAKMESLQFEKALSA